MPPRHKPPPTKKKEIEHNNDMKQNTFLHDKIQKNENNEYRLAKNLAPYRIGKRPHKQNRAKIYQNTENRIF